MATEGGCILKHGDVFLIFFSAAAPFFGMEGRKNKEESTTMCVT